MMIRRCLNAGIVLSLAAAMVAAGCNGGANMAVPSAGGNGGLTFKVVFPTRTAQRQAAGSLPIGARSVRIGIQTAGSPSTQLGQDQVVAAPTTGTTATVTFPGLPAGPVVVNATANSDLAGQSSPPLATATQTATIVSGQTTNVTLSFTPTITQVVVQPSPANVGADSGTTTLTAKAETAGGQPVPGAVFFWSSSNTNYADVSAPNAGTPSTDGTSQATITGHAPTPVGSPATIQVREFSSGLSATDAVTVQVE